MCLLCAFYQGMWWIVFPALQENTIHHIPADRTDLCLVYIGRALFHVSPHRSECASRHPLAGNHWSSCAVTKHSYGAARAPYPKVPDHILGMWSGTGEPLCRCTPTWGGQQMVKGGSELACLSIFRAEVGKNLQWCLLKPLHCTWLV